MEFKHNPTESTRITRIFGKQEHPITHIVKGHNGIDIGAIIAGKQGDPLYAVDDGVVVISKVNGGGVDVGYGYYIIIQHKDYATLYGHMTKLITTLNQKVKAGEIVGYMGNTGSSTGTHLHFGLMEGKYTDKKWINPLPYILQEEDMFTQEQWDKMMEDYLNRKASLNPENWGKEDVEARAWCEKNKIIVGNVKGYKQYESFLTRHQMAVIIYRLYKFIKGVK